MNVSDVTARLKKPEYTGENRCLPCTVVNVLLACALAVGLSAVATPVVGVAAFAAAIAAVYLRGYLVPGTPRLTEEYFPPWALALFGKEPVDAVEVHPRERPPAGTRPEGTDDAAIDDPFAAAGVLEADDPTLTSGEPSLSPEFEAAWRERTGAAAERGVDPDDVARAFGASEASATGSRSFVLDGDKSVRWGSEAALFADVAAASLLSERLADWDERDRERRRSVLLGLRLCLGDCPTCGGRLSISRDRVDPCCQKPHLVAESVCEGCGAVVADAAVVDDGETETVRGRLLAA